MRFLSWDLQKVNKLNKGDVVKVVPNAVYYNGTSPVPKWVTERQWILKDVDKNTDKCILGIDTICKQRLDSAISSKYLKKAKNCAITYTVESGDTWQKLADKCGVRVQDLKAYNNATDNILYIGQKILIPPVSV